MLDITRVAGSWCYGTVRALLFRVGNRAYIYIGVTHMKALILTAMVISGFAAQADQIYVKGKPGHEISKLEAMRILITSNNKEVVYKCAPQEMSNKGTVKNK